jgi:hypothetical protein
MTTKKDASFEAIATKALSSWQDCNDFLRDATESQAYDLLQFEQAHKCRIQYVLRIHARFNRQRATRERSELLLVAN